MMSETSKPERMNAYARAKTSSMSRPEMMSSRAKTDGEIGRPGLYAMDSAMNLSLNGPSFAVQVLAPGNKDLMSTRSGSLRMSLERQLVLGDELKEELRDIDRREDLREVKKEEGGTEKEDPTAEDKVAEKIMGVRRMSKTQVGLLGIENEEDKLFEECMGISIVGKKACIESRRASSEPLISDIDEEGAMNSELAECLAESDPYNVPFTSKFRPDEMRCLALVAHNHMKPAMKDFVLSHKEILKKFRLTGTNTTMAMLKRVFGDDPSVMYGPTCQSGPLGGDAELCALMCLEDLGGMIFFVDPLSAHPHQADIDSLNRLANVHNIITALNPASAHAICFVLKCSLEQGRKDKIPSFFYRLQSPGVKVYKEEQRRLLEKDEY